MRDRPVISLKVTKDPKSKSKKHKFCVDDPTLPGTPMVGYGESIAEALGNWIIGNSEYAGVLLKLDEQAQKHTDKSNAIKIGLHR